MVRHLQQPGCGKIPAAPLNATSYARYGLPEHAQPAKSAGRNSDIDVLTGQGLIFSISRPAFGKNLKK
jgi:hypothetical protein